MGDFFKPWQRKIGVLTLVMACVFMAGWVRSMSTADVVGIPGRYLPKTTSFFSVASTGGSLEWRHVWPKRKGSDFSRLKGSYYATSLKEQKTVRPFEFEVEWETAWCGVCVQGGGWGKPNMRPAMMRIVIIPYWSIVIPLTLLSAWLLFSKPRAKPVSLS